MGLIKGIHHVSLKACTEEEYLKVKSFYKDVLEISVAREWVTGIMFDTGAGLIEIFNNGNTRLEQGAIRHLAFAVDNVDACVKKVMDSGYEVFDGPRDVLIPSTPPFPAKVAFCYGPLGEEIEFFEEK